jgi:hypothetical protein
MSDETTTPEEVLQTEAAGHVPAETEAPAPVEVEAIFIIAQRKDGSHFATVDLNARLVATRAATAIDLKRGCSEILEVMRNNDLAGLILGKMAENTASESDKVSSSIRQALSDKGIL